MKCPKKHAKDNSAFLKLKRDQFSNRNGTKNEILRLTPICDIWECQGASFVDRKSEVTFLVLMTSYIDKNCLLYDDLKSPEKH